MNDSENGETSIFSCYPLTYLRVKTIARFRNSNILFFLSRKKVSKTKHSMRSRFSVSTNIHNGSSNPSNRFYRLIILNLLYSQYNHLERDHHEFKKATMASLCIPRTLPPVCSETVEDKIDKISSRKGRRESGLSVGAQRAH